MSPSNLTVVTGLVLAMASAGCGEEAADGASVPFDYCDPGGPPDATCYSERRSPDSEEIALARAIADRVINDRPPETIGWDWADSVMMFGIAELYRATRDVRYRDYLQAWLDHHIDKGYKIALSDGCPPAIIALLLLEELGDQKYRAIVDDVLHYLRHVALRTEEGGLNHFGAIDALGVTLWVDSLFMFGNVLNRWAELSGDEVPLDEYAEQFGIFATLLQKPSGLFQHAYGYTGRMQEADVFWARGNAWVTAATYEYLRVRLERGESDPSVSMAVAAQLQAAIAMQDPTSGLWRTVMNRPGETYEESSGSALFVYAMARAWRYGLASDEVLGSMRLGQAGVIAKVETDDDGLPVVTGISGPTSVGDFEYYASVPVGPDISHGVGAVLLMLVETSGLPL